MQKQSSQSCQFWTAQHVVFFVDVVEPATTLITYVCPQPENCANGKYLYVGPILQTFYVAPCADKEFQTRRKLCIVVKLFCTTQVELYAVTISYEYYFF